MPAAYTGFVLAGGRSARMGRDKAFLPLGPSTLLEHIAQTVHAATGNVAIIGPVDRYRHLGYPVIPDEIQNRGPLAGLLTALSHTQTDWNLIVACDMPALTPHFLDQLLRQVTPETGDCLVPQTAAGLDPLCAVYHRRCLAAARAALDRNLLKMQEFVSTLQASIWPVPDPRPLANVNTPEDWLAHK